MKTWYCLQGHLGKMSLGEALGFPQKMIVLLMITHAPYRQQT